MFRRTKLMKWIYSVVWTNHEWAQRDYDALRKDPELKVLGYGSAPMFAENGEMLGYAVLFTVMSTKEKFERVKEVLKETHKEDSYMGLPILKCAANVKRVEVT